MSKKIATLAVQRVISSQEKIDGLNNFAREAQHTNTVYASQLATQAYLLSQQGEFQAQFYHKGMIEALITLATINELQNNLPDALKQAHEAFAWCDADDTPNLRLWALNRLAWSYFRLGNHSRALEFAFQQLSLAEQWDDLEHRAHTYNVIGAIYGDLGYYEKAITQFELCLRLFQALGNTQREQVTLGNFCKLYGLYGQPDRALEYGLRALQMSVEAGDLQYQANILLLIGHVYNGRQEDTTALEYYQQGLSIARDGEYTRLANELYLGLGQVYFRQQQAATALEHIHRALAMAQEAGYKTIFYESHRELSKVYESLGDFQRAFYHYQQYHQIRETVLSQEQTSKMQHLQLTYDIEQAQREAETQRRLHEEEVRYYEQLSRMKDELIGTASHDLKSPLSSIMLNIEFLRRHGRLDDERGQELLQRLDSNAERMRELIRDLLDLAKLETGQGLHLEEVALKSVLEEAINTFQPLAQQRHITLHLHTHVQTATIRCDTHRLRQAIDNLLSNAIKYSHADGQVGVHMEMVEREVIIKIQDTGMGIPSQDIPRLFERFYRVNDQEHMAVEGTGLGLAIVKSIIEQHGGKIWVESQSGVGSTFSFSLPHPDSYAVA